MKREVYVIRRTIYNHVDYFNGVSERDYHFSTDIDKAHLFKDLTEVDEVYKEIRRFASIFEVLEVVSTVMDF